MEDTYILDSSVVIEILRGNEEIRDATKRITEGGEAVITSVTKYEVLVGVKNNAHRKIVELIPCVDIGCRTAAIAADLQRELKKKGLPATLPDTLIAAKAKELNATVLTRDRDFERFNVLGIRTVVLDRQSPNAPFTI